ncbi:MAG: peptidylprolyl isomerase [Minisyncoccota bacterium]
MIKKILSILAPILFLTLVYLYGGNILNSENKKSETQNDQNQIINPVKSQSDNRASENKNMNLSKPSMQIDKSKTYTALLKTTMGDIEIALNAKETPITVNNFVYLAKNNFYSNTIFHRTIKDFMIQGGDPTGTGMGGPGYKFDDENFSGEYLRGTLAMANSGPDTNGSQFFIMHKDVPLQKNYVIFGKVVKGIEVVDKIALAQVIYNSSGELSKPVNPVVINSVEIIEQ